MAKITNIFILFILFIYSGNKLFSQSDNIDINFCKEITYKDTCFRFYSVKNFNQKNDSEWYILSEYLYNIVLNTPISENWISMPDSIKYDPLCSSLCNNIIFFCFYDNRDNSIFNIFSIENDKKLKKNIICKFYYNNSKGIIKY